ncbi:MAG: hypothetical protein JSV62_11340 [Promethearchaeota archaeon]|nr:MAG: hypothetical protein JSV62_11340 [Candidatus Lokiarchaeota archaeon]
MLSKLKPSVKEPFIIYSTGLILIILSVIFFSIRGYPLVSTATEILNIYTPPIYMIPIFFPYGILIGEVIWSWNEQKKQSNYILLIIEIIIIGLFSFIRYFISIPFSGHAIILSFYLLHEAVNNRFNYPLRILIGIAILILTLIYKVYLWNDPITFLLGALLGVVLWIPGFFFRLKISKRE